LMYTHGNDEVRIGCREHCCYRMRHGSRSMPRYLCAGHAHVLARWLLFPQRVSCT
jgi:hypothetical protein